MRRLFRWLARLFAPSRAPATPNGQWSEWEALPSNGEWPPVLVRKRAMADGAVADCEMPSPFVDFPGVGVIRDPSRGRIGALREGFHDRVVAREGQRDHG